MEYLRVVFVVFFVVGCGPVGYTIYDAPDLGLVQPGHECQHPAQMGDICPSTECAAPSPMDMGEASYSCCDSVNVAGVGRCCQFYTIDTPAEHTACSRCDSGKWQCRKMAGIINGMGR